MLRKLVFITCLLLAIQNIKSATTHYQRITYNSYTPASATYPDYHSITILYKIADVGAETVGTGTWKYSYKRTYDDALSVVEAGIDNNNSLYERYKNYLISSTGVHASKHYVAWDITATCDAATDIITVTFKIKYFTCEQAANSFYDELATSGATYTTTNDNKVRFTTSGPDATDSTSFTFETVSTDSKIFLQGDSADILAKITTCSA